MKCAVMVNDQVAETVLPIGSAIERINAKKK
jgi:hypothetical protein